MLLKEAARSSARSVAAAFGQFLENEINIPKGTRSVASTSQQHLREFLSGEASRDESFPRVLSRVDDDFLGGSFARHTKTWPLDDIDIYCPLDGLNLTYFRGGVAAPYTVLTDGVVTVNPLLQYPARWMEGPHISSRKLIDEFAAVLRRHYPAETRVRRAGEAVNIKMSNLGFDVVPCFSLKPTSVGAAHVYVIPDGKNGWIETNPKIDIDVAAHLQSSDNQLYRPTVKLVKWWNAERFGGYFSSYYLELAIMRRFLSNNRAGQIPPILSDAVATGFEALRDAATAGDQSSWLPNAPTVVRGAAASFELLNLSAGCARDAATAERQGNIEYAMKVWKVIFGDKFPE